MTAVNLEDTMGSEDFVLGVIDDLLEHGATEIARRTLASASCTLSATRYAVALKRIEDYEGAQ